MERLFAVPGCVDVSSTGQCRSCTSSCTGPRSTWTVDLRFYPFAKQDEHVLNVPRLTLSQPVNDIRVQFKSELRENPPAYMPCSTHINHWDPSLSLKLCRSIGYCMNDHPLSRSVRAKNVLRVRRWVESKTDSKPALRLTSYILQDLVCSLKSSERRAPRQKPRRKSSNTIYKTTQKMSETQNSLD